MATKGYLKWTKSLFYESSKYEQSVGLLCLKQIVRTLEKEEGRMTTK